MAKLHKSRPVKVEKMTKSTWVGTKLDTIREKMHIREQKTAPKALSAGHGGPTKSFPRLTKLGTFLQRKRRASRPEQMEITQSEHKPNTAPIPAVTHGHRITKTENAPKQQSKPIIDDETPESSNAASPKSVQSFESPVFTGSSQTSLESSNKLRDAQPTISDLALEGIIVRDLAFEQVMQLGSEASPNPYSPGQHDAAVRSEEAIMSSKSPSQEGKDDSPPYYSQAELEKSVAAAIETSDAHWKSVLGVKKTQHRRHIARVKAANFGKLEHTTASLRLQADAKESEHVIQVKKHWASILGKEKNRHQAEIEQLKAANIENLESTTVALKSKLEAQKTRHEQEAQLKQETVAFACRIWQQKLDEQKIELEHANEKIDILEQSVEFRTQQGIEGANATLQLEQYYTASHEYFINLKAAHEHMARDLAKKTAEVDQLTEKYLGLEERYSVLAAEHNEAAAKHDREILNLEEELDSAQSCLQQLRKSQEVLLKPSGNSSKLLYSYQPISSLPQSSNTAQNESSSIYGASTIQKTNLGQQNTMFADENSQTPSQRAFAANLQAAQEVSKEHTEVPTTFFDGLPSSSSYLYAPQPRSAHEAAVAQNLEDKVFQEEPQFTFASPQPTSFDLNTNSKDKESSTSQPTQSASASKSAKSGGKQHKAGKRGSRFQSMFDEQATKGKSAGRSPFGDLSGGDIR